MVEIGFLCIDNIFDFGPTVRYHFFELFGLLGVAYGVYIVFGLVFLLRLDRSSQTSPLTNSRPGQKPRRNSAAAAADRLV